MNEIININPNKTIKQSNKLVVARYRLTKYEQRMMIAICSQLNKNADEFETVRVRAKDLADFCRFKGQDAYRKVHSTILKLMTRTLQIQKDDGKWYITHWLQSAEYLEGGIIEYRIDQKLKPDLLQLKSAYLSTPAEPLMQFKRDYSARLYFLLRRMVKLREYTCDLDFIRDRFQLGETYKQISNLKDRILEPALTEINEISDIEVKHEYIKEGRSYKKIHFFIRLKKAEKKEIVTTDTKADKAETDVEDVINNIDIDNLFPPDFDWDNMPVWKPEKTSPANPNRKEKEPAPAPAVSVAENKPADETNWSDEQQADYDALIRQDIWVSRAKQIVNIYDHERIKRNLEGVLRDKLKGTISNPPAVIVSAINDDSYKGIAEEKAKAQERIEEKKREEWEKQEKVNKEKEENRQKENKIAEELVKIRANKTKEELIEVFERISKKYSSNNKILTTEMLAELKENGISQRDFSSYQGTVARKTIKYIQ